MPRYESLMNSNPSVRIGTKHIDEAALNAEIIRVQTEIEAWGRQNELWHDDGFVTPFLHHNDAPQEYETLLLVSESSISRIFALDGAYSDFESSFLALLDRLGYDFEMPNHYSFDLFPKDDRLREDFLRLHRWQWLQHLAQQKLFELHSEVFEHFAKYPQDLQRLEWRQFEELLDAIFKNQGFYTELGPGRNDGGVDHRLYQSRSIPELVSLVQAKRYQAPIQQEAVAALWAHAVIEGAPRALFATTSRFQPAVVKFACSVEQKVGLPSLELADNKTIAGWCAEIGKTLDDYFSNGQAAPPIITEETGPLAGKIVVAQIGYNSTRNVFAKIEADYKHEVILRSIGKEQIPRDGQEGFEVPAETMPPGLSETLRMVGKKSDGGFWANRRLYSLWDGTPQRFNGD
jgi:Restriction endonuclease